MIRKISTLTVLALLALVPAPVAAQIERREAEVVAVFRSTYGDEADRWFQRWRLFFLACEELFGFRDGSEWVVGHYRLAPVHP